MAHSHEELEQGESAPDASSQSTTGDQDHAGSEGDDELLESSSR